MADGGSVPEPRRQAKWEAGSQRPGVSNPQYNLGQPLIVLLPSLGLHGSHMCTRLRPLGDLGHVLVPWWPGCPEWGEPCPEQERLSPALI